MFRFWRKIGDKLIMKTQLNVKKILLGAFVLPWYHRNFFCKALIVPLLFIVILEQGMHYIEQDSSFKYWVFFVLHLIVMTLFSVICHQLVLIDPQTVSSSSVLRFGRREIRFIYWLITFSLTLMVIAAPGVILVFFAAQYAMDVQGDFGMYVAMLGAVPAFYITARFSLMFPAIATDKEFSLKSVWRLTAGNGWRLVIIVAGFPVILVTILNLLTRDDAALIEALVYSIFGTLLTAVEVVAVSLAYRELMAQKENQVHPT
jgi:hypothetical protein